MINKGGQLDIDRKNLVVNISPIEDGEFLCCFGNSYDLVYVCITAEEAKAIAEFFLQQV